MGVVTGVRVAGDRVTITMAGELDMGCAHLILDTGRAHLHASTRLLTLDMTAVTFLDSSAITAIIRLHKAAAARGALLRLDVRHHLVVRVLQVTGLGHVIPVNVAA